MKAIWMAVAVALSLSSVACGSAEGKCKSGCKDAEDCDIDGYKIEDCEKGCEAAAEAADEADCKAEFKDYVSCAKKEFECEPKEATCESEGEDYGKCILDAAE